MKKGRKLNKENSARNLKSSRSRYTSCMSFVLSIQSYKIWFLKKIIIFLFFINSLLMMSCIFLFIYLFIYYYYTPLNFKARGGIDASGGHTYVHKYIYIFICTRWEICKPIKPTSNESVYSLTTAANCWWKKKERDGFILSLSLFALFPSFSRLEILSSSSSCVICCCMVNLATGWLALRTPTIRQLTIYIASTKALLFMNIKLLHGLPWRLGKH